MISSLKSAAKERPELIWALLLFLILMVHGATVGLTDDEAYYWVLAQKPDWGYAFHPPMVAWLIAVSQSLLGGLLGSNHPIVVRFPAALCSALVLGLSLKWIRGLGGDRERMSSAALTLLSLAGLFSLSWMMVPDLPLFLGWMLSFVATWRICFREERRSDFVLLAFAIAFSVLSKYSGILIGLSSLVCVVLWAPRERRFKTCLSLVLGGTLAALPILFWNSTHEWGSILYQIRDRHEGGSLSLARWGRFWLIELFAAGPVLILWGFSKFFRPISRIDRFLWVWAAPAVFVFCLQPLWSDFKPHWALIAWWPMALMLAYHATVSRNRWAVYQMRYGLTLGAVVLLCCHLPIGNFLLYARAGDRADPRLDVTNDLFAWRNLKAYLRAQPGNEDLSVPVVGSRYQTASQAYFALGAGARVTMLPRDLKARDEWPALDLAQAPGPGWSPLKTKVFFVTDNRYDSAPEFPGSSCVKVGRVQEDRAGHPAKWIDVWRCEPTRTSD